MSAGTAEETETETTGRRPLKHRLFLGGGKGRGAEEEAGTTVSAPYAGDLPLCTKCINQHSPYC